MLSTREVLGSIECTLLILLREESVLYAYSSITENINSIEINARPDPIGLSCN